MAVPTMMNAKTNINTNACWVPSAVAAALLPTPTWLLATIIAIREVPIDPANCYRVLRMAFPWACLSRGRLARALVMIVPIKDPIPAM